MYSTLNGAIVFRAIFVLAGTALLSAFTWLVFVFGAFLIFTGFRMSAAAAARRPTTRTTVC